MERRDSNLGLPDPKAQVTHMWPHPWVVFSKTGTCSQSQPQQREQEGAQRSVRTWRVAAPVPLSCLIPHFYIILAFHMFTSHFPLRVLTLARPKWGVLVRSAFLYTRWWDQGCPAGFEGSCHLGGASTVEGLEAAEPFLGLSPGASS